MNILVVGGGGREHALAVSYTASKKVKRVFVVPGNGLMDYMNPKISIVPTIDVLNFEGILNIVKQEKIDLVDVAQDDPLAQGLVDVLEVEGIKAFGPTRLASQLEWDKAWARNFMVRNQLPIPQFKSFTNQKAAMDYVSKIGDQLLFIKASGLAFGKGAIKATNKKEAIWAIKQMKKFGKSGETFLIEQGLVGEEFSLFAFCDGQDFQVVSWAQDHKTIYDGDLGPNTGGVGCVAPTSAVTDSVILSIKARIIKPLMDGMGKEGRPYVGVLYLGGMVVKKKVYVIEFNVRWGDPEAEVILPAIKTDYLSIVESVISGKLKSLTIKMDNKVRISVAGCAKGYPGDCSKVKGKEIFGLQKAMKLPGITIFGAAVKRKGRKFLVNGGRIFHLVAEGKDVIKAQELAYHAMGLISIEGNNLHYRTDIGWRDVAHLRDASAGKEG